MPLPAAAVQYPARHEAVVSVVVGARDAGQVRAAACKARTEIPPDLWLELAEEGLIRS